MDVKDNMCDIDGRGRHKLGAGRVVFVRRGGMVVRRRGGGCGADPVCFDRAGDHRIFDHHMPKEARASLA